MFHTNPEFNFPLFTLFKISRPYEEMSVLATGVSCQSRHQCSVHQVAAALVLFDTGHCLLSSVFTVKSLIPCLWKHSSPEYGCI